MKSILALLLLVLPLTVQAEPPARGMRRIKAEPEPYQTRNLGKSDERFKTLLREIEFTEPGITAETLYSRLLRGETFKIRRPDKIVVCKDCNGFGKVPDKSSSYRSKDGKVDCPSCAGIGKLACTQIILVKW